ncbi:MAG TPA: cytochrome c biogenesis protein CcdA [Castellaniella sp.]|uniref:protein-disulfide reductase DsbD family protein n=1 Tax=Castellaniella sp. TaxID=1955812 RepID=UPI002F09FE1A
MSSWLFTQILLAIGAGLLLNLTPCVLPAVPLKVRAVLNATGDHLKVRIASAALFTAGSVLFFAALGIATALLQWQWGVLFQSRALLIVLGTVLTAFAAMNFLGRGLPVPNAVATLRGGKFLEPFFSGLISALLSTPCTGPLLGGVLVFALAQPTANIVALFVSIGLGLALPYVVLLLRPGLLKHLPRAGAWTEVIRQSFGWLLLAAALFYLQSAIPASWVAPLWAALFAGVLAWAAYRFWRAVDRGSRAVALFVSVIALASAYAGAGPEKSPGHMIAWQPLRAADVSALPTLGRPAIVEFTAQWCINCKVLEKTTYEDSTVVQAVARSGVVAFQADLTHPDLALEHLLASYGGVGLPFLAVLDREGRKVRDFSGLFTGASLVKALKAVGPQEDLE